jgi:hypothetical protein
VRERGMDKEDLRAQADQPGVERRQPRQFCQRRSDSRCTRRRNIVPTARSEHFFKASPPLLTTTYNIFLLPHPPSFVLDSPTNVIPNYRPIHRPSPPHLFALIPMPLTVQPRSFVNLRSSAVWAFPTQEAATSPERHFPSPGSPLLDVPLPHLHKRAHSLSFYHK